MDPLPPEDFQLNQAIDFSELILQKLQTAQHQKQFRSSQSLPRSTIISKLDTPSQAQARSQTNVFPPTQQKPSEWQIQKAMLIQMLEKTQQLAVQAQQSSYNDKAITANKVSLLTKQIQTLTEQNYKLKRFLSKPSNLISNIDAEIVKELKALQEASEQREQQHKAVVDQLQEQLAAAMNQIQLLQKQKQIYVTKNFTNISSYDLSKQIVKFIQISEANSEISKLTKKMDILMKISCEKQAELTEEIQRLQSNGRYIAQASITRQQTLSNEIKQLSDMIQSLQQENTSLKNHVVDIYKQFEEQHAQSTRLYQMMNKRHQEGHGPKAFSTINQELNRLNLLILDKESEIDALKCLQKQQVTSTDLASLKQLIKKYTQNLLKIHEQLKELNQVHSQQENKKIEELQKLHEESSLLRQSLNSYTAKNFQNQLATLRIQLQRTLAEKNHAKRLIMTYVRSIQELETGVKTAEFVQSLENERLLEQNNSLVETRANQEKFFQAQMKNLQEVVDRQNKVIRELNNKIDFMNKQRMKELEFQVRGAHQRLKKSMEVNQHLKSNLKLTESSSLLAKYQSEIEIYKKKLQNQKGSMKALKEKWLKEKQAFKKEIQSIQNQSEKRNEDYWLSISIQEAFQNNIEFLDKARDQIEESQMIISHNCDIFQLLCENYFEKQDEFFKESAYILQLMRKDLSRSPTSL